MKRGIILLLLLAVQAANAEMDKSAAKALKVAHKHIVQSLKDPDSAKFRDEYLIEFKGENSYVVCGNINAKNSYGAYSGYVRYHALVSEGKVAYGDIYSENGVMGGEYFYKSHENTCIKPMEKNRVIHVE